MRFPVSTSKGIMDQTERLITWGLLALIAYELRPKPASIAPGYQVNSSSPVPGWVQQYSYTEVQDTQNINTMSVEDDINNLLSLPQGPGGTGSGSNVTNFYNPTNGMLSLCTPAATPQTSQPIDTIAQGTPIGGGGTASPMVVQYSGWIPGQ